MCHASKHAQTTTVCVLHTVISLSPQQQLNNMKDESKFKSKQIEAHILEIHHLSEETEVLSSSLQEKEAVATTSEWTTDIQASC